MRLIPILAATAAFAVLPVHASAQDVPIPSADAVSCPNGLGYVATVRERPAEEALRELDLNSEATSFHLLGEFEGTSIIIRVKNADGDSVAVIKTDTSNTSTEGEVFVYRLAKLLGFDEIVAPAIPVELGDGALIKVRDLLRGVEMSDTAKEQRRAYVLRQIEHAIREGDTFHGAMKPWLSGFMFTTRLGRRESVAEHEIMNHLHARGEQPSHRLIELAQFTRLYSPHGTHRGRISVSQLARDFSNIMVMDALSGQNDRFAGANMHFRAVDGERHESGSRRGLPIYDMEDVRLLALDNGASLHSAHGSGLADLMGNIVEGTRVERFEERTVDRLRRLGELLLEGYGTVSCELSSAQVENVWSRLGVFSAQSREYAIGHLRATLEYIDSLERRFGEQIYFDQASVMPAERQAGGASEDGSESGSEEAAQSHAAE
jgi:hypothetical protein